MDKQNFAKMLPEQPPEALLRWAGEQTDELGPETYISYRCERVEEPPDLCELMDNRTRGRKVWATVCTCSECGGWWITRKGATAESFFVVDGEDGQTYPAALDGREDPGLYYVEVTQGDSIVCPECGAMGTVIRDKEIRMGRTKRLQVAQLTNVGQYTTIIYWLAERYITPYGTSLSGVPRYAYALDERGRLKAFRHAYAGGWFGSERQTKAWVAMDRVVDAQETIYADWGSMGGRKRGTASWPEAPTMDEMAGTTGEKTGIERYWEGERSLCGLAYLKAWRRHKSLENVVRAGLSEMVDEILDQATAYGYDVDTELAKYMNLKKAKPHEILRMTKEDFRSLRERASKDEIRMVQRYRAAGGKLPVTELIEKLRGVDESQVMDQMERYGGRLEKYIGYMEKQGLRMSEIRTLGDTRRAAEALHQGRPLTEEELWPRRLQETHDRLTEELKVERSAKETQALQAGFDAVREKYAEIEWTDGRLAVILPKSNTDLIREGATLRHCVGTYGKEHAKGRRIILFIRHYRRPERSYYTLNIGFDGGKPYEIQLHGYGNEHHGDRKQYTHKIPQEVRDFVDRWEKEVLEPWAKAQAKNKKKEDKVA